MSLDILQRFVREVLEPTGPHCPGSNSSKQNRYSAIPLLLHINDFLPLYNDEVIDDEQSMSQIVDVLANYYGFASMSYIDMVRDFVFGDPAATWFAPNQFPKGRGSQEYRREVHPGLGMHTTTSWMVAFNLLNLATTYCDWAEWWSLGEGEMDLSASGLSRENAVNQLEYQQTVLSKWIPLNNNGSDKQVEGNKPLARPNTVPPELKKNLTVKDLNANWRKHAEILSLERKRTCSDSLRGDNWNCAFAWITGQNRSQNSQWIQENLLSRVIRGQWTVDENFGWRKTGLMSPPKGGSVIEFSNIQRPVGNVLVFYTSSYSEKWKAPFADILVD